MKSFIITFFSPLIVTSLMGQTQSIGLTTGLNLSRVSAIADAGFQPGPMAGISYQLRFSKILTFGADLIYDSRGGKNNYTGANDIGQEIRNVIVPVVHRYVSIPLKMGAVSQGNFFGFGNAGIVPSYILSAHMETPGIGGSFEQSDITEQVHSFDIGILLEGGVGVRLGDRMHMQGAVSAQRGLLEVYDLGDDKDHHFGLTISVAWRYTFGATENVD